MMHLVVAWILAVLGVRNPTALPTEEHVTSPRVAQVRLAETLGEATAIHGYIIQRSPKSARKRAVNPTVVFVVSRGAQTFEIAVTTQRGEVNSIVIRGDRAASIAKASGDISWLADEMASAVAITKVVVDSDGALTLTADDNRRYAIIPGRGSGGANAAVAARWAGEWDR